MPPKSTKEQFIQKAKLIYPNYNYDNVNYINNRTKTEIGCPIHGLFLAKPNSILNGHGCPKCKGELLSKLQRTPLKLLIEKFVAIHENEYDYNLINESNYVNNRSKIPIICKIHDIFYQSPELHLRGHGCPFCYGNLLSSKEDFINKSNIIPEHNNKKYDYSNVCYINDYTKVEIICPLHGSFLQRPNDHLQGLGCRKCGSLTTANKTRKTTEEFIKQATLIHGDLYNYSKVVYINSHSTVEIICSKHGSFLQTPNAHLSGCTCPRCHSSRGENAIELFFKEKLIKINKEFRFDRCRYKIPLPFDFYLPELNICIEYDGEHHYYPVYGLERFIICKRNDNIKNKYCVENDICLIRIPYWERDNIRELLTQLI